MWSMPYQYVWSITSKSDSKSVSSTINKKTECCTISIVHVEIHFFFFLWVSGIFPFCIGGLVGCFRFEVTTTLLVVGVEVALGCGVVYWSPDVDGRGEEKDLPARIEVEPSETDGVAWNSKSRMGWAEVEGDVKSCIGRVEVEGDAKGSGTAVASAQLNLVLYLSFTSETSSLSSWLVMVAGVSGNNGSCTPLSPLATRSVRFMSLSRYADEIKRKQYTKMLISVHEFMQSVYSTKLFTETSDQSKIFVAIINQYCQLNDDLCSRWACWLVDCSSFLNHLYGSGKLNFFPLKLLAMS